MRQDVVVSAGVRWPTPVVRRVLAEEVEVLFGARHRPMEEPDSFPVEVRVPIGRHAAVSCAATVRVGRVGRAIAGARPLTITPMTKRWLFPSFTGTLATSPRDAGCALLLTGTARVPYGLVVHRRWGRRSLERSLSDLIDWLAANVDRHLDKQSRADARRALLPLGSPERRVTWSIADRRP